MFLTAWGSMSDRVARADFWRSINSGVAAMRFSPQPSDAGAALVVSPLFGEVETLVFFIA
jgi:hypothetical protein